MGFFLSATEGNGDILREEYANLIIEPVTAEALPFNPAAATAVKTDSYQFRIPVLAKDAGASWVNEGKEITTSEPMLKELHITPQKVAGLTIISRELAHDSTPGALEIVGRSLARAIVEQVDRAFLNQLADPAPLALPYAAASGFTATTPEDAHYAIREAIASTRADGATPTAVLLNPADAFALVTLPESDATRRTLLEDVNTIDGVPTLQHHHVPRGRAWVLDASRVFTVLREGTTLAMSEESYFTSDQVALRATMRIGFGYARPELLGVVALDGGDPHTNPNDTPTG